MSFVSLRMRTDVRERLTAFVVASNPLGLKLDGAYETFLRQLYDSIRRVEYYFVVAAREPSAQRTDPTSPHFDPLRAAAAWLRAGDLDEAAWLLFLATHFGAHRTTRWQLVREVYGDLGGAQRWNWPRAAETPGGFSIWLSTNHSRLGGRFGNHRKYMSLKPTAKAGTGDAVESYVSWIRGHSSHEGLIRTFAQRVGTEPGALFDALFASMQENVRAFGRTGCFDFLCTLGKMGAIPIEPSSPCLSGSTGPRKGTQLLLFGEGGKPRSSAALEQAVVPLGRELAAAGVRFAMQVLEDAICNWQKSPGLYVEFTR